MATLEDLKRRRLMAATQQPDDTGEEEDALSKLKKRREAAKNESGSPDALSRLAARRKPQSTNDWLASASALLSEISEKGGNWYDRGTYEDWEQRVNVLQNQGARLSQQYGSGAAGKAIDDVVAALGEYKGIITHNSGIYSQFENQEAYDTAVRYSSYEQKYADKDYPTLTGLIGGLDEGEEKQWLSQYAASRKTSKDYSTEIGAIEEQISEIRRERGNLNRGSYLKGGLSEDEKKHEEALAAQEAQLSSKLETLKAGKWRLDNEAEYAAYTLNPDYKDFSVDYDNRLSDLSILDRFKMGINEHAGIAEMTEEEYKLYKYLEQQGDSWDYYQYLKPALDARTTAKAEAAAVKFADDVWGIPSIASVPLSLLGGSGYLDASFQYMRNRIAEGITGEYQGPVNYNTPAMLTSRLASTIREAEARDLANDYGTIQLSETEHPILSKILNGKSWGDVYQVGMSMADSLAVAYVASPAIGTTAASSLLGGNAATQGMLDAVSRGATDSQALAMGLANGAFELIFEKYSLESLLKGNTRNIIKSALQQGGVEASEEVFTSLANNFADIAIMMEKSGYMLNVQKYISNGYSESEATRMALTDMAVDLGWDAVFGFLSGGVMGGTHTIGKNVGAYMTGKDIQQSGITAEQLKQLGLAQNLESQAFKTASGLSQNASVYQIGALAQDIGAETGRNPLVDLAMQRAERQATDRQGAQQAAEIPESETATVRAETTARTEPAAREVASPTVSTEATIKNFRTAYDYGFRNEAVADIDIPGMTDAEKTEAWNAGKAARDAAFTPGRATAFVKKGKPGIVESPEAMDFGKENKAAYKQANSAAKAFGLKMVLGRYGDTFNGKIQNGVVFLNLDRIEQLAKSKGKPVKRIMANVIAHEITHRMQQTNPKAYLEYRDVALRAVAEAKNLETLIDDYKVDTHEAIEKQKADGKTPEMQELTDEEAMDEIVADLTADFIENTDKFSEFVNQSEEHRSLGKKLLDFLKKVIADIKARFKTQSARDLAAANEFGFKLTDLEEAAKKWEAAWKASEKAVKKAPVRESTGVDVSKYSLFSTPEILSIQGIGRKSVNEFNSEEIGRLEKFARKYWKNMGVTSPFFRAWFGDWRAYDTTKIQYVPVNTDFVRMVDIPRGSFHNNDTGWDISSTRDGIDETVNKKGLGSAEHRALSDLDSMLKKAVLLDTVVASEPSKRMGKSTVLVHHLYCPISRNGKHAVAKLYVTEDIQGQHRFYLTKIEEVTRAMVSDAKYGNIDPHAKRTAGDTSSEMSVAEIFAFVKEHDADYEADSDKPVYFNPKPVNPVLLNADGTPKKFYHGTPNGDFSVFNEWQYFTENKEYADLYQGQGASSNGYKKTARNRKTYETYLAPKKIFDTRTPADRKIFEDEFYGKWGNGAPLSEKGLPDWTDGDDLTEFFAENGYDYDAILLDEGATGGYGEEVISRGISIVVRDSTAIKSATDNIGTFDRSNPDIRYSVSGTEELLHKATDKELDSRYEKEISRFNFPEATAIVEEKARRWGAILDKDGKPKRFYHGTSYGGFTEFDAYGHGKFGLFGIGNYFTENRDVAASYMEKGNGTQPEIYSVYLKADNPIDMDANADIAKWQAAAEEVDFAGCKTNEDCFVAMKEYCEDNWMVRWEAEELIMETIKGMGYDGITHIGGGRYNRNSGPRHRVVITFEPDQARSATTVTRDNDGVTIPLSERFSDKPDYRYSLAGTESLLHKEQKKTINDARNAHGTIKPGEKPAREAFVPKAMEKGKKVSMTIRTALEAGATPDAIVPKIADGIINGQFSDEVHTNNDTLKAAKAWIEAYPIAERALDDWNEKIKNGRNLDETDTVKGYLLYNLLATRASEAETTEKMEWYSEEAIKVLTSVTNLTRSKARMVQSTRLLKKLTPAGQYFSLERAVERLNQQIADDTAEIQLTKGRTKLEIDQDLARKWMQALHDGKAKEAAYYEEQLYQSIAKQVKRTFMDRWNAWRYLSMLGNAKTITRNLIGNLFMIPVKATKDKLGAIIELAVPKESRTKYLGTTHTERGNAIRAFAKEDFTNVKNLVDSDPKYSEYSRTKLLKWIQEYKSKFQWHGVKEWQQLVDWVMNGDFMGDSAFMRKHYTNSFTQIAMARGWTADAIKSGKVNQAQLDIARGMAFKEAQKATFRDINAFSGAIRKMRFKDKGFWRKTGNILLGGVLPFRQTPANVLVRAVEYSPIEIVWNLTGGLYQVAHGKISATEYIDHWASALTGSAAFGFGMLLRGLGVISGGELDDDEERMGIQKYSLNIGGKSFSLDWLSPMAIPFFMGVEIQKAMESNYADPSEYISAFLSSFQPILEMSCLSGVQSLIETQSYVEGSQIEQLLVSFIWQPLVNYVAQGIPTFLSQTASTTEKQGEKTYTADMESALMRDIHYPIIKALEKIPGVEWRQVPRVDAWGRVEEKKNAGDYALGALESYLSPAYINDVKVTNADKEIERLQGVFQEQIDALEIKLSKAKTWQEKKALQNQISDLKSLANISPDVASTKIGQIRLEQQEYIDYATVKGQQNYELVTALMDSDWYKGLNDERKSAAIRKIYELADAKGQYAAIGLTKDNWTQFSLDVYPKKAVENCQAVLEANWKEAAIKSENSELKNAILSGTSADKAISELKKNGKTDEDIKKYARTEIHEMFKSGELNDKSALDRLKKYGGYSSDEANDKVTYWKFQNENLNSELSQTVALTWYRTLKGSGVALSDWEKAWYFCRDKNLKKQDVDAYLNSLTCPGAKLIKKAVYKHKGYK